MCFGKLGLKLLIKFEDYIALEKKLLDSSRLIWEDDCCRMEKSILFDCLSWKIKIVLHPFESVFSAVSVIKVKRMQVFILLAKLYFRIIKCHLR